ncbi:alpha/beta hydrolase [Streptacidiphilus carbonis]|jgi:enterochelin esterase-like enzyme|uniref:alpha/beta hydrolase n=1 Tax=Streptacidiphilus carbonis TaxID=105422 RepID=UPI000694BD8D|nr:alpha/beta hydrolase-fold protein [Streptacidiphilus carbonis]
MSLTGTPFFAVTILLVVLTVVALVVVWNRIPGPAAVRGAARVGLIVFSQAAAVVMVLVFVNNRMGPFYDTWGSLFGQDASVQVAAGGSGDSSGTGGGKGTTGVSNVTAPKLNFSKYSSDVLGADAVGPESRIKGDIYVWLPPQYSEPAYAHTSFPVLELLPGTPGTPKAWFGSMHADSAMRTLMSEGKVKPMILVAAKMNMYGGSRDSGCANLPGSYQTATWLAKDVPALMKQNFRVSGDRRDWGIAGYSAGGYCAANLIVQYPQVFRAAVTMSGYNTPDAAVVLKDPALTAANNPLLQLRKAAKQPDIVLMAQGVQTDGTTVADARALVKALHTPGNSQVMTFSSGGHDTTTFIKEMGPMLTWMSKQLTGR